MRTFLLFLNDQNDRVINLSFDLPVSNTFKKWEMAMDGNTLATIFGVLHIIWVLPLGYFSVMDILEAEFLMPL